MFFVLLSVYRLVSVECAKSSGGVASPVEELKNSALPLVINTWEFTAGTWKAWETLNTAGRSCVDAVVEGCSVCERLQCNGTVGYGGSPDELGETTLDAMIFDGRAMDMGAVGALRRVRDAMEAARLVLERSEHSVLVGRGAAALGLALGLRNESLASPESVQLWDKWKRNHCQPNFWRDVLPNPNLSCGPYRAREAASGARPRRSGHYDTVAMAAIDGTGHVVAGTSSNGAPFKMAGRVGDAAVPGAGAYADDSVGAALASGDGDVMMRFLPAFLAVELMRGGRSPKEAAAKAVARVAGHYPTFYGALLAVARNGSFHAACNGMAEFPFSVVSALHPEVRVFSVRCGSSEEPVQRLGPTRLY